MYTYIIIDDEKLIRQGTIKKLNSLKTTATCIGEADNGQIAINMIAEKHPDIVILDMQMPVMNGTKLLPFLFDQYPNMPLIVISGYKDFDYVKHAIDAQAIDYILKPFSKETIQNALLNAISRLESRQEIENHIISSDAKREAACYEYDMQMLKNLVLGYHVNSTILTSHKLSYINQTHSLYLVTFYFSDIPEEYTIANYLDENAFGDLALYVSNIDNSQIGFMILFLPENPSTPPSQMIWDIVENCNTWIQQQEISAIIGVSNEHHDLKNLSSAFQECATALDLQNLQTMSQIPIHLYHHNNTNFSFINWTKQEEFLFRIETGMEKDVRSLLDDLFSFYITVPNLTLGDVKYHCYCISELCRNILNYYFDQNISSNSASIQNAVTSIFSLADLKKYYLNFFLNIANMLKSTTVYSGTDVVEQLKIYVERNYQKNLSMDFLSSLFFMNRSYLSHLFRLQTKCNFVDYVNQVRICKAKEMLLHSEVKMYQIAKNSGYDNVKYFFRIFKKTTGLTPVQYQLQNGIIHSSDTD